MKVSALVLTYNEEINIEACLKSLNGIEDVLVVDSGSTDQTCTLAERLGARVLSRSFDNFANQRNFGLDAGDLKHEWVLHLDADEVVTPQFLAALSALEPTPGIDGYRVPSKTMLKGSWLKYSGMYPTYQVRLGHRDRMRFKMVGHGQREDLAAERVDTFHEPYLHFNFSHGLTQWLIKHARYAEAEADQVFRDRGKRLSVGELFSRNGTERRRALKRVSNRIPAVLRPPLRFIHAFVLRRGFLDGHAGFQYAVMLACYESMIAAQILDKRLANCGDNISFRRFGDH
jgi:glycosyltransferase involved in cell wall biosynthesis